MLITVILGLHQRFMRRSGGILGIRRCCQHYHRSSHHRCHHRNSRAPADASWHKSNGRWRFRLTHSVSHLRHASTQTNKSQDDPSRRVSHLLLQTSSRFIHTDFHNVEAHHHRTSDPVRRYHHHLHTLLVALPQESRIRPDGCRRYLWRTQQKQQ